MPQNNIEKENNVMENKFKTKVEMLSKCAAIVEELNTTIDYLETEIAEQKALPEEEHSWRYESIISDNPAKIDGYKRIIAHLEKLL